MTVDPLVTLTERDKIRLFEFELRPHMKRDYMMGLELLGPTACGAGLTLEEVISKCRPFR